MTNSHGFHNGTASFSENEIVPEATLNPLQILQMRCIVPLISVRQSIPWM